VFDVKVSFEAFWGGHKRLYINELRDGGINELRDGGINELRDGGINELALRQLILIHEFD